MVADQLKKFKVEVDTLISNGVETNEAITQILRRIIGEIDYIIFNGNNYSDEWVVEAEKRGLKNIKSTPEALEVYLRPESLKLFIENNVFNETEVRSRYNIYVEEYTKKIEIESLLIEEIALTQIIPAVIKYQNKLIDNVKTLIQIGLKEEAEVNKPIISQISNHLSIFQKLIAEMKVARENAHHLENEGEIAKSFHRDVKHYFDLIRKQADSLEMLVDDKEWPLTKYRELLFLN